VNEIFIYFKINSSKPAETVDQVSGHPEKAILFSARKIISNKDAQILSHETPAAIKVREYVKILEEKLKAEGKSLADIMIYATELAREISGSGDKISAHTLRREVKRKGGITADLKQSRIKTFETAGSIAVRAYFSNLVNECIKDNVPLPLVTIFPGNVRALLLGIAPVTIENIRYVAKGHGFRLATRIEARNTRGKEQYYLGKDGKHNVLTVALKALYNIPALKTALDAKDYESASKLYKHYVMNYESKTTISTKDPRRKYAFFIESANADAFSENIEKLITREPNYLNILELAVPELYARLMLDINDLYENNKGLIATAFKLTNVKTRIQNKSFELDDVRSIADFALYRASVKYDPMSGNKFSTLAVTYMKNAINNALLGDDFCFASLDKAFSDNEDGNLLSIQEDPNVVQSFESASDSERNILLKKALAKLDKREKYIVEKRFGLGENEEAILEEIGNELGITRERVRQLEARALKKLEDLLSSALGEEL